MHSQKMTEAILTKRQYSIIRAKDPERFPPFKILLACLRFDISKSKITISPAYA